MCSVWTWAAFGLWSSERELNWGGGVAEWAELGRASDQRGVRLFKWGLRLEDAGRLAQPKPSPAP